jgi:hypothetical protein
MSDDANRSMPRTRLVDLLEPDLSAEAARLAALRLRAQLSADTQLLGGRPPDVLVTLFEHLQRAPVAPRRRPRE